MLVIIHKGIQDRAQIYREDGTPVWELSKSEGDAMAAAAQNVVRHYEIAATQKMFDIGAAVTIAFGIYMPRIGATVEAQRNKNLKPANPIVRHNVGTG